MMLTLRVLSGTVPLLASLLLVSTCSSLESVSRNGLKPGLNYMQPLKWRMTYTYRIQEIKPKNRLLAQRDSGWDPSIPAVGKGTYELWLTSPREGEDVRSVKRIVAQPEPTAVQQGRDTDAEFVYYNFSPDGYLPREVNATVAYEFITLEPYAFWEGADVGTYDKKSDLYLEYTKEEKPITFFAPLVKAAKKCVDPNDPDNYMKTALNCYNFMLANFSYDHGKVAFDSAYGFTNQADAARCFMNKAGKCDEFASVYCAMLRSVGIPARPVAGWVHAEVEPRTISCVGGHAWAEFYLPNVGWVPVDPTWGPQEGVIEEFYSPMGHEREIPRADYWFGKHDPYRLALYKDWNYRLNPKPKTPNCSDREVWNTGVAERRSGVEDIVGGFLPSTGVNGARAENTARTTWALKIELLGAPSRAELSELKTAIEKEGANFLNVAAVDTAYPLVTADSSLAGR